MKILLAATLSILLLGGVFSGCSNPPSDSKSTKGELDWLNVGDSMRHVKSLEAQHPEIRTMQGSGPDGVWVSFDGFPLFGDTGTMVVWLDEAEIYQVNWAVEVTLDEAVARFARYRDTLSALFGDYTHDDRHVKGNTIPRLKWSNNMTLTLDRGQDHAIIGLHHRRNRAVR